MQENYFAPAGIYYRTNDFKDGRPTAVFVHGLGGSSSAWHEYEKKFENKYNILTLDLRGHGVSKKYQGYDNYAFPKLAEDLHQLLNYLEVKNYFIISHSFGTLVSLELLRRYPDQPKAAVFLSPNFGISKIKWARITNILLKKLIKHAWLLPSFSRKGKRLDYRKYLHTGDWNVRRMLADMRNTDLRIYLSCSAHIYESGLDEYWKKLTLPILIVHGKDDTVIPLKNASNLAKEIKNSKLVTIENAHHIIVLNNFSEVADALEKFIDKVN